MKRPNSIDSCILCNSYPCLCSRELNGLAEIEDASDAVFRANIPSRAPVAQASKPRLTVPRADVRRVYNAFIQDFGGCTSENMTREQRRDFLLAALVSRVFSL